MIRSENMKVSFSLLSSLMMFLCLHISIATSAISIFAILPYASSFIMPTRSNSLSFFPNQSRSTNYIDCRRQYSIFLRNVSLQSGQQESEPRSYHHTLAILTFPRTSIDKIANEAILETCMKYTKEKISIVLRCPSSMSGSVKLNELRGYVGEIYSLAWDCVLGLDKKDAPFLSSSSSSLLLDVIVYPQYLPNAAPEEWINHRPDLDCICTHDSITGWYSSSPVGTIGESYQNIEGSGMGGLDQHVDAVNEDRKSRGMSPLHSLHVENWPKVCSDLFQPNDGTDEGNVEGREVVFMEDEEEGKDVDVETDESKDGGLIGGGSYRIPSNSLYSSVAVGGTFDGMHYGHRKLLTLAVSSVIPNGGKLLVGITTDEMLKNKAYANLIPSLDERIKGVREFIDALAPGMKNRMKIVPITDTYGPVGTASDSTTYQGISNDFDALVLSHETLLTGQQLNEHRVMNLGMEPLKLLCTRRTEAHGMSSTALRKMRKLNDDLHQDLVEK